MTDDFWSTKARLCPAVRKAEADGGVTHGVQERGSAQPPGSHAPRPFPGGAGCGRPRGVTHTQVETSHVEEVGMETQATPHAPAARPTGKHGGRGKAGHSQ